jgi:hypothetical protein
LCTERRCLQLHEREQRGDKRPQSAERDGKAALATASDWRKASLSGFTSLGGFTGLGNNITIWLGAGNNAGSFRDNACAGDGSQFGAVAGSCLGWPGIVAAAGA